MDSKFSERATLTHTSTVDHSMMVKVVKSSKISFESPRPDEPNAIKINSLEPPGGKLSFVICKGELRVL